ncbi:MAG: isoprenylcysteine carboxylmethyltransferase family protein [Caldilinea sp. CFX5]|nr:isoprenylcysteine carboxylmethyltransferase family protein [Caldilinea sp. CFX5]
MVLARQTNNLQWRVIMRTVLGMLAVLLLVFGSAGRWDYWQGWLYFLLVLLTMGLMWLILPQDSTLVEERLSPGAGMKGWDGLYFALSTPLYLIALLVAGLDVGRFGWTGPLPVWCYVLGVLLYLIGQGIFLWARYVNHFFSSVVRIQLDRGQTVCTDGPYRYVRHPGYVGGILFGLAAPLILGSVWALIPQALAALLLIWRTAREDRTLQAELPGYEQFMQQTRYRLLPGVW